MIKLLKQDYKFIIIGAIIIALQVFSLLLNLTSIKITCKLLFFGLLAVYCYNQTKFNKKHLVIISCFICFFAHFALLRFLPGKFNYLSFYFSIATVFYIRAYYLLKISTYRVKSLKNIIPYFFIFLLFFITFFILVQIYLGSLSNNIIDFYYGLSLVILGTLALKIYLNNLSSKNVLPLVSVISTILANLGFAIFSTGTLQTIFDSIENILNNLGHYFFVLYYVMGTRD